MQLAIAWAVRLVAVVLLVGLIRRRRLGLCWTFVGYLAVTNVCALLILAWPATFYTPWFWILKNGLYDVVKLLLVVELAWRAVAAFPHAAAVARRWTVALLVGSTVLILLGPTAGRAEPWEWLPRAQMAVVWLISLTGLLVYWYRLPVHGWHRAILLGLAPYLAVFTTLLEVLHLQGWRGAWWVGHADAVAYLAIMTWWAYAAWRPERAPADVPVAVLRRLGMEPA